jgi:hypothetical protein
MPIQVASFSDCQPFSSIQLATQGPQYLSQQSDVRLSAGGYVKRNCNTDQQRAAPYPIPQHRSERHGATSSIQGDEPIQSQYPTAQQQQQLYPLVQPACVGMLFNGNASITHSTVVMPDHNRARDTPFVIGNNNTTSFTVATPAQTGTRDSHIVVSNNNATNVSPTVLVPTLGGTRDSPIVIDDSNNMAINLKDLACDSTTTPNPHGADLYNDRYPYGLQNYIIIMGRNHETDALEKAIAEEKSAFPL